MAKKRTASINLISPFDQAKYNFTKNLAILTGFVLFGLSFIYFFQDDFFFWPVIAGSAFAFITYFILVKTSNIKLAGIFAILSINIIIVTKFLTESQFHYFEDFFWIMCITIFAFFVLGKWYGILTLCANVIFAYIVFYAVRHSNFDLIERPYKPLDEVNFAINLSIGSFIFIRIVLELLKQNKLSEEQYLSVHKQLEIQHEEKTVMLMEIHHRVKNNLQIITSLLRLQSADMGKKSVEEIFSDSINRISAIAKIHDRMYNRESLNQINLQSYLSDLVSELISSYGSPKGVKAEVHSNVKKLDPKHLVPIALIFNELVTNSIKHAFKNTTKPEIQIEAKNETPRSIALIYNDNGKWIEPDPQANSIGLELIESFVAQLDGTLKILKTNGTTFIIHVNLD